MQVLLGAAQLSVLVQLPTMDVEPDTHLLPRAELVKTIVAALPVTPDPTLAADDAGDSGSGSDDGPRLEYVTQLERSCDNSQLAAALSSLEVNLYAADTMALAGQLKGHTAPLTQLAFDPSDATCLFSASEDGTVRCGGNCVAGFGPGFFDDSLSDCLCPRVPPCAPLQLYIRVVELYCCGLVSRGL